MLPRYLRPAAILITLVSGLQAMPLYYSFSGTVFGNTGIAGYTLGQDVSLVLAVDRAKPGYRDYNGTRFVDSDTPDEDYFQVDYLAGDLASDAAASNRLDSHTGFAYAGGYLWLTFSNLDPSGNDYFTIQDWSHTLDTWTVGQGGISGSHIMWDDDIWWYQTANMTLTLTDISATNPLAYAGPDAAPEPSGIVLIAIGLAGLALAAHRRGNARATGRPR